MKKLLLLASFSLLLIPANQAFADSAPIAITPANSATLGFSASNSVELLYGEASFTSGGPQSYVAMAKHSGGDKVFGTTTNTNLIVTATDDDCKGANIAACLGSVTTNALDADLNGEFGNVENLNGWSKY